MVIQRGEIWWASLPEPIGSEPGYRRPILVIQSNDFNRSRIATIIATGLAVDSVANISQVLTIDKSFLTERIGVMPPYLLEEVETGLRLVMSL
jgi:mRNA interferase MazF